MSASRQFFLVHDEARRRAVDAVRAAPEGWRVMISPKKRSLEQNARMWAMLADVSEQVEWHSRFLSKEEWKDVFTAALKKQSAVPGIDGGFVVLGAKTSGMTVAEMGDLMTLIEAFGAERGVVFNDFREGG